MEITTKDTFWCMTSPDGDIYMDTIETTERYCWQRFLHPGLKKEGYIGANWKPKMYKLIQVKDNKRECDI